MVAFSDKIEEFRKHNAEVIGVSTDSQFSHLAWTNQPRKQGGLGKINYPLLADLTQNISRDYGVLLEDMGVALRGTFIIDPDGVVAYHAVNHLDVGRSVDEVLRVLTALQHISESGQVCPAGWAEGEEAISKDKPGEWFEKHAEG